MTNEEIVSLLQHGDGDRKELLTILWSRVEKLVWKILHDHRVPVQDREDVKQEAFFYLCRAVGNYDAEKGTFVSFFTWWMRSCITTYFHRSYPVSLPSKVAGLIPAYKRLQAELGRKPTAKETAAGLDVSETMAQKIMYTAALHFSGLDELIPGTDDVTVGDTLADGRDDYSPVESGLDHAEVMNEIRQVLTEKQYAAFCAHDLDGLTFEQIGSMQGKSRQAIQQQESIALKTIRNDGYIMELLTGKK